MTGEFLSYPGMSCLYKGDLYGRKKRQQRSGAETR